MDTVPQVLNIKGTKLNPQFDIYIGRQCYMGGWKLPRSKWYNPFTNRKYGDAVCDMYRDYVESRSDLLASLPELSGKKLGCWCHPNRCHGHVLQELYVKYVVNQ